MTQNKYEVYRHGNYMILDRLVFPRIRIFVIYQKSEPVIDKITLIDKASITFFGPALKEIEKLGILMAEKEEAIVSLVEETTYTKSPEDWLIPNKEPAMYE